MVAPSGVVVSAQVNKPIILIVDDNPTNVELIRAQLKPYPYRLVSAYDGEEALQKVREEAPDLVLLDLMMPKLSGYEVCKILKSSPETQLIPIIIVTALRDLEDKLKSIELGADDVLIKPFNKLELTVRIRSLLRLKALYDDLDKSERIVFTLAETLEAKDVYTRGHSERVAYYALRLGKEMGLSELELEILQRGCRLHDVGKIAVRDEVLNKRERLTPEEIAHIRTHPERGYEICKGLKSFKPFLPIILHHHEHFDGKGWPAGLKGTDIPLAARICAVCDTYDAMTSDRCYRRGMNPLQAARIMEREADSGQWDPDLVRLFVGMLRTLPGEDSHSSTEKSQPSLEHRRAAL